MSSEPHVPALSPRQSLRRRLLAEREAFASDPSGRSAQLALAGHLVHVLAALEPQCLGLYWPVRFEFNAITAIATDAGLSGVSIALPYSRREPRAMHYRRWDGSTPRCVDECGIAASDGADVVPDVVLAPCVGFTREGYRLGYGGGYFDRWMAAHPHVTAVGVAWSVAEVEAEVFGVQAHDQPLMLVITERGVVGE